VVLCTTMQKKDRTSCVKLCSISKRCRDRTYIDNTRKLQNHKIIFYRCNARTQRCDLSPEKLSFERLLKLQTEKLNRVLTACNDRRFARLAYITN
jgi:hypothetical protein